MEPGGVASDSPAGGGRTVMPLGRERGGRRRWRAGRLQGEEDDGDDDGAEGE